MSIVDLPNPLIDQEVDLRDYPFMPLDVERLRRSRAWRLIAKKQPELGFYMMNLWCAAYHEVPCGSLEDDDDSLADFAMCSPKKWSSVREKVLHGWVKCSDGRLYHPVVVEKALEGWEKKSKRQNRAKAGGIAKWASETDHDHDSADEIQSNSQKRSKRLAAARALGRHTHQEWIALLNFSGGCVSCGAVDGIVQDHIRPIYQGGSDSIENIQPLCRSCNSSKGANSDDLRSDGWREAVLSPQGIDKSKGDVCLTPASQQNEAAERLQMPAKGQGQGQGEREEDSPLKAPPGGERSEEPQSPAALRRELEAEFEDLWKLFPRKVSRGQALKAFLVARRSASLADIERGIIRHRQEVDGKEPQFIPHPATWLNGQRWLDEPQEVTRANGQQSKQTAVENMLEGFFGAIDARNAARH